MAQDPAGKGSHQGVASGFLAGDPEAVRNLAAFVRLVALPFRGPLGADWEDAVQESLTRLIESLRRGEFRAEGSLKAYARRTVYNLCVDRVRSRRVWRWTEIEGLELPARVLSPLAALHRREFSLELLRVLEAAPGECRRLWEMLLDGLSYREMSERTGVGEVALRSRVLRCRRKALALRESLAGTADAGADTATNPSVERFNDD